MLYFRMSPFPSSPRYIKVFCFTFKRSACGCSGSPISLYPYTLDSQVSQFQEKSTNPFEKSRQNILLGSLHNVKPASHFFRTRLPYNLIYFTSSFILFTHPPRAKNIQIIPSRGSGFRQLRGYFFPLQEKPDQHA